MPEKVPVRRSARLSLLDMLLHVLLQAAYPCPLGHVYVITVLSKVQSTRGCSGLMGSCRMLGCMQAGRPRLERGAAQVFGLLDMQEQVEARLANMAATLESSSASNILADFTQLAAMIRQEVHPARAPHLLLHG